MYRILLCAGLLFAATYPVSAQSWVPWHQPNLLDMYKPGGNQKAAPKQQKKKNNAVPGRSRLAPAGLTSFWGDLDDEDDDDERPVAKNKSQKEPPKVVEGGPRPDITPRAPQTVSYKSGQPAGTIVIDSKARRLYLIRSATSAYMYPVSVGREGFAWSGQEKISRMTNWPDWHPPAEMRERDPKLPIKMTGGLWNPLGAKALYLGNSLYRIHGTSNAKSIGRAASSGCFRMHNYHVVDLAQRVRIGTKVVVINAPPLPQKTASAGSSR